jgi:hypothetical protein
VDYQVEFLYNSVLVEGKEYRDFWLIPYEISKEFSPDLINKMVYHLIKHEMFLTDKMPGKTVPLEAYYLLAGARLQVYAN